MSDLAKRRIMIRPCEGGEWLYIDSWSDLDDMIEEDGQFEIRFIEMTDAEVEALGEFAGW